MSNTKSTYKLYIYIKLNFSLSKFYFKLFSFYIISEYISFKAHPFA